MQVGFSNFNAGYDMTRTLLDKGRTRIVYFGSRDDRRDEARYQGYCRAMSERGAVARRVNPKVISSQKLGAEMMENALALYPDLDAVFCTNDDLALGALVWCLRKKIPVPERIAIAGFHGLDISREMYPTMASVITPRYNIGYTAAELLLKKNSCPLLLDKNGLSRLPDIYGRNYLVSERDVNETKQSASRVASRLPEVICKIGPNSANLR